MFFPAAGAPLFKCMLWRNVASSLISTKTFRRADSVGGQMRGEREVPLQWRNQVWRSLDEGCRKARLRAYVSGHIICAETSSFSGVTNYGRIWREGAGK